MAGAGAHSRGRRPSLSGIVDSTPSTSVVESFSQDDLLALVWGTSSQADAAAG